MPGIAAFSSRRRYALRSPSALPIAGAIACRCSGPSRLSRVPNRTAAGTAADLRDGAPEEPAVIVPDTASNGSVRTSGHSIAVAAAIRRSRRRQFPNENRCTILAFWTAERLSRHTGTQQAAKWRMRALTVHFRGQLVTGGAWRMPERVDAPGNRYYRVEAVGEFSMRISREPWDFLRNTNPVARRCA
ncbi:MAG: hypothetical protein OXN81_20100 [Alphaproteobacteria bacterium]|nr:hypothetical protein [Alphaproteobacteria bacterium]